MSASAGYPRYTKANSNPQASDTQIAFSHVCIYYSLTGGNALFLHSASQTAIWVIICSLAKENRDIKEFRPIVICQDLEATHFLLVIS